MTKLLWVLWKDLILELRTKELLTAMGLFALLVLLVFNFAFQLQAVEPAVIAPGVLWLAFTLASLLGLNRSFVSEVDRGSLDGLRLAPLDPSALFLAKALGNTVSILALQAVTLPLFALLFNRPLPWLGLLPILILGALGIAGVGTLFAAMAVNTRAREILLPLLLLPVIMPVLIATVRASALVLSAQPPGAWLGLLVAFDALYLALGSVIFEFTLE